MAGVLDALATYVTNMLADMAREEVAMMIGVSGGIDDLSVKLRDLRNFLADADRRNITDESVQGWVEELKHAMYHATDILDLCQLKFMEQGPSKDMGCLNPLLFCMRNPLHAHDIGIRIKTLNKKLDDIYKRGCSFNFIKLEAYKEQKMTQSLATDRKTDSLLERSGAVGEKIEEDTRALVEVLTNEVARDMSDRLMVVAIVGVGGIGKTTLGKKIFNDEAIEGKFTKKIWLSITCDFDGVELLSTAIVAAGGELPRGGGDEALVASGGDTVKNKLRSHNFLRFSMQTKGVESNGFEWSYLSEQKSLRTLILSGKLKIQPGDSIVTFLSLRTLSIESTNVAALIESVCQLKHLRYLSLTSCTGISSLPEKIHQMKFLQHIDLEDCEGIMTLPDSIIKLRELRYLDTDGTQVNSIPRNFDALTNLRVLWGFPAYMDGDWCSLEELGPLSHLKELGLKVLENLCTTSSIAKARLDAKPHLKTLALKCGSRLGDDGLLKGEVTKDEEQRIEVVFNVLCPLPCLECLIIQGYFGRHLPIWMKWTTPVALENLRTLFMRDLACCTQLPDGLCWLPCLEYLALFCAPAIKRVGSEFVQPHNQRQHASSHVGASFPRLHQMILDRMVEWEEWEWDEEMKAMPSMKELQIKSCKLRCIPPGLAFHARSLKKLTIWSVKGLNSLENFASVVELDLYDIPYLTRISNFPRLQRLEIDRCPMVESLQEMNALRRLVLTVHYYQGLPLYLEFVKPSHLLLDCSPKVVASMALGKSGPEWEKFSHIQHVEAFADDGDLRKKWHLVYTSEPYSMETNIDLQES